MSKKYGPIYKLLQEIFDTPADPTMEYDYTWEDIFKALSEYIIWLEDIKQDFGIKKQYSIEHLAEQLFSPAYFDKQVCKYHISMLYVSIKMIEDELNKAATSAHNAKCEFIQGKLALLRDLVWDGFELIGACEEHFLNRAPTVGLGRRRLFSSNEIFYSSIRLLRRHFTYDDITFSSLAVFQIRQAIETKVLNSLGVGEIIGADGEPAKFKLERLIEFVDKNDKIVFPVKKSLLLKITKWTNFYIHRGIMNYHWMIMLAHEILKPLFQSGKGKRKWSLYGAVKIDEDYFNKQLKKDLLEFLELTEASIKPLSSPEALVEPHD